MNIVAHRKKRKKNNQLHLNTSFDREKKGLSDDVCHDSKDACGQRETSQIVDTDPAHKSDFLRINREHPI